MSDSTDYSETEAREDRSTRESSRLVGTVKWFNAKFGYGFITRHDTQEDVFVHFSGISKKNTRHSIKSLGDGELVEFNVMATSVSGPNGRPVKGNPYVSHIPRPRNDAGAAGDTWSRSIVPTRSSRFGSYSRIPRPSSAWNIERSTYR